MKGWTFVKSGITRALGMALLCVALQPVRAEDVRERLNKIFYWHLSDDLKLTPKQEKEMASIIEDIQKRRQTAMEERDTALEALRKLGKNAAGAAVEKALTPYRAALVKLGSLDVEEFEKLKALFGAETLARYYVVREDVLGRVREALRAAEAPKK